MASQVEQLAAAVRVITSDTKVMAAQLAELKRRIETLAARVSRSGLSSSEQASARALAGLLDETARTVRGAISLLEQSSRAGDRYAGGLAGGIPGAPTAPGGAAGNHPVRPAAPVTLASGDTLAQSREPAVGQPGGLLPPSENDQAALERECPRIGPGDDGFAPFVDPRTSDWILRLNDGGISQPGRGNNCLDCSLSVLSTWFGMPNVSAPRTRADGTGEAGGPERAAAWVGRDWEDMADGMRGLEQVADRLRDLGPGSAAIIWTGWEGSSGSHAWNALNVQGDIVWVDGQIGMAAPQPHAGTSFCRTLLVDPRGGNL